MLSRYYCNHVVSDCDDVDSGGTAQVVEVVVAVILALEVNKYPLLKEAAT